MSVDWASTDEHNWHWDSAQGAFAVACPMCGAEMLTNFDYDDDLPAPPIECVPVDRAASR